MVGGAGDHDPRRVVLAPAMSHDLPIISPTMPFAPTAADAAAPPSIEVGAEVPSPATPVGDRRGTCFRVLVVCTANHCRSPLAAALLAARLAEAGLAERIAVESAGLRAVRLGRPPSRTMVEVGRRRGVTVGGVATLATPERLAAADLVVCMDHEQLDELRLDARLLATPGIDDGRLVRGRLESPRPRAAMLDVAVPEESTCDRSPLDRSPRGASSPDPRRPGDRSDPATPTATTARLLLSFAPEVGRLEVPDPQGRDLAAHERVADLIEAGVAGLAAWIAESVAAQTSPRRG